MKKIGTVRIRKRNEAISKRNNLNPIEFKNISCLKNLYNLFKINASPTFKIEAKLFWR